MEAANKETRLQMKKLLEEEKPEFKRKGNEHQYIFANKVLQTLQEAKTYVPLDAPPQLLDCINQGELLLEERKKHLKIADRSDYGWTEVRYYTKDPLAVNAEDERRMKQAKKAAKEDWERARDKKTAKFPRRGRGGFQRDFVRGGRFRSDFNDRQDRGKKNYSPEQSSFRSPRDPNDVCKSCDGKGHWSRDRVCPKFKRM